MEKIIKKKAELHLYYLCVAAVPLWIVWILFDYWFAIEQFYPFLVTRILGSLLSILLIINHYKKWVNVFSIQLIMFVFYNAILSYYVASVPEHALSSYFNGYMMVMIVVFFMLIIRFKDILWFSIQIVLAFIAILQFGDHSVMFVMANGGFSFLTIFVLMIFFAILRYRGVLRDVSLAVEIEKAKETEEMNKVLEAANKEKETLLQEIHHRVKNNLQLVSSMLSLQKSFTNDEKTKNILLDSKQRITTMSRIHETLYKSTNFSSIDMSTYITQLVEEIIALYNSNSKRNIILKLDLSPLHFNINTAIPVGLIINEMITNSIKHAFPNDKGTIWVTLKQVGKNTELTIKDNGKGFLEDFSVENSSSLGMELISTLTEQIDSELEVVSSSNSGVEYKIIIPS